MMTKLMEVCGGTINNIMRHGRRGFCDDFHQRTEKFYKMRREKNYTVKVALELKLK